MLQIGTKSASLLLKALRLLTVSLLATFFNFQISSAENVDEDWEVFGSFIHNRNAPTVLFFFDVIKPEDSFEFRRALRTHDINTVVLASDGGSVWEALTMSGIISDRKLVTYIPAFENSETGCFSACAFMFFAGNPRIVEGDLGVHQFGAYNPQADEEEVNRGQAQQITQFTTSEVIGFLNEFNTPPWVYERMFRSREIYTFSEDEKVELTTGSLPPPLKTQIDQILFELKERAEAQKVEEEVDLTFNTQDQSAVRTLQTLLRAANCSPGPTDGIWGRRTSTAAQRFAELNNLSYQSSDDITPEFISTLSSNDLTKCPDLPRTTPNRTMAQNWAFSTICQNQRVAGSATIRFQYRSNVTNVYRVYYSNALGYEYEGMLYQVDRNISFTLQQTNGSDMSRGNGDISTNWRTVTGRTDSGCQFTATSR